MSSSAERLEWDHEVRLSLPTTGAEDDVSHRKRSSLPKVVSVTARRCMIAYPGSWNGLVTRRGPGALELLSCEIPAIRASFGCGWHGPHSQSRSEVRKLMLRKARHADHGVLMTRGSTLHFRPFPAPGDTPCCGPQALCPLC